MPPKPHNTERDGLIADLRITLTPVVNEVLVSRNLLDPDDEWESFSDDEGGIGEIIAKASREIAELCMRKKSTYSAEPEQSSPPFPSHRRPATLNPAQASLLLEIHVLMTTKRGFSRVNRLINDLFESDRDSVDTREYCLSVLRYIEHLMHEDLRMSQSTLTFTNMRLLDVVLTECPAYCKIKVIKALMDVTGMSLFEAKSLAESAPATIVKGLSETAAAAVKRIIEDAGGHISVV